MKPAPFDYQAPHSLEEALALKAQYGDDAKFLAGGQSLIPAMNFRLAQASLLVGGTGLPSLDFVREAHGGELRVGALTRQRKLERDPLVARHAPLLRETMPYVAHPQIRKRGTLGGSLAHAADEMLVEVALPALPPRTGTAFVEFARRRGDYALMGVAAVVTLDGDGICQQARLGYPNAGEGPGGAPQGHG